MFGLFPSYSDHLAISEVRIYVRSDSTISLLDWDTNKKDQFCIWNPFCSANRDRDRNYIFNKNGLHTSALIPVEFISTIGSRHSSVAHRKSWKSFEAISCQRMYWHFYIFCCLQSVVVFSKLFLKEFSCQTLELAGFLSRSPPCKKIRNSVVVAFVRKTPIINGKDIYCRSFSTFMPEASQDYQKPQCTTYFLSGRFH